MVIRSFNDYLTLVTIRHLNLKYAFVVRHWSFFLFFFIKFVFLASLQFTI